MGLDFRREQLMGGEGRSRGKDFERDLFGLPRVGDPKYREELSKIQDKGGYAPFGPVLDLVRKIQPTKARPFAFKLIHKVAEIIRKNHDLGESRVRFLTTVETPLDEYHGTDAIIELVQKGKGPIRVRLGATTENESVKSARGSKKPDIEIESIWLNIEDEEGLNKEKIPELANQIAHHIKEEMATKEVA